MKFFLWIATLVCFLFSWWWYVCPHKQVCPFGSYGRTTQIIEIPNTDLTDNASGNIPETTIEEVSGPIVFAWSDDEPITSAEWESFRDSILSELDQSDILEITGNYYLEEDNNTAAEDLGWARANQVRNLFSLLDNERIKLESQLIESSDNQEPTSTFNAVGFRRVINNDAVKEIAGRMVIHFPFASDEMLDNPQLHTYLDDLVDRLQQTDEKVHLVGHTDDSASSARNMSLGQMRAEAIRDLLIRKGLEASRITTESKGENDPIASNDTDEGRRLNRRVELTII